MSRPADARTQSQTSELQRHWDSQHNVYAVRVLPGQYYVSGNSDEMISTVLGSCIAACIRDSELKLGGLNHFMLPEGEIDGGGLGARYGAYAMEHLINDILKLGGRRDRLEVKLFGGGKIMAGLTDIGRKNIEFVKRFLATEGLTVVAEDLGEAFSRKVNYFPTTGRVLVKRLRAIHTNTILEEERAYSRSLKREATATDIELFD